MTDPAPPIRQSASADPVAMFPTLTPAQLARVAAHRRLRPVQRGDVLIEQGDTDVPFFVLRTHTEIVALEGDDQLERVRWRNNQTGEVEAHGINHVFVMTGAAPNTRWLDGCVALDANGFIKTGQDLSQEDLAAARWPLARPPHLLETSLPGVFAVGDVRAGNIKRVASAVGEGAIAVAFVHKVLDE